MTTVLYKRCRTGMRRGITFSAAPREWKEFVTWEHSAERWMV